MEAQENRITVTIHKVTNKQKNNIRDIKSTGSNKISKDCPTMMKIKMSL